MNTLEIRERVKEFLTNDPFADCGDAPVLGGIAGGEEPSRYSHSPSVWNRFFEGLGITGRYTTFDLPRADRMKEFMEAVFSLPGFVDFCVTNPYKADAFRALDSFPGKVRMTERVRVLKSLNHLTRDSANGEFLADSTDGLGMIRALKKRTVLRGKKVLLAGAGGAALSIGYELLQEEADVTIINIIPEDGDRLAGFLASRCRNKGGVSALPWDGMREAASSADIVISAITSGTPFGSEAAACLPDACIFADARYGEKAEFARAVRRAGRACVDGREMLYGQFRVAAESLPGIGSGNMAAGFIEESLDAVESWFCPPGG